MYPKYSLCLDTYKTLDLVTDQEHFKYKKNTVVCSGFIRVREMSGKFKIFQGQGIVREFHNLSGKIEFLLKCQGNVREFQNFK